METYKFDESIRITRTIRITIFSGTPYDRFRLLIIKYLQSDFRFFAIFDG